MNDSPGRAAPAFQMYADDFLAGTIDMSPEEVGVYVRLLCLQWSKGGISERQMRAAGGDDETAKTVLELKFYQDEDGLWRNRRLESVRQIQASRAEAGSKGGSKRQANRKQTTSKKQSKGQAKSNPPSPTPSPTPSPNINNPPPPKSREPVEIPSEMQAEGFPEAWQRWMDWYEATNDRPMPPQLQQTEIMRVTDLAKAVRDIDFSIGRSNKRILDSDDDFDKRRGGNRNETAKELKW